MIKGLVNMVLVIWHDNGINGHYGASDEKINSVDEIQSILERYKSHGIIVYKYAVVEE